MSEPLDSFLKEVITFTHPTYVPETSSFFKQHEQTDHKLNIDNNLNANNLNNTNFITNLTARLNDFYLTTTELNSNISNDQIVTQQNLAQINLGEINLSNEQINEMSFDDDEEDSEDYEVDANDEVMIWNFLILILFLSLSIKFHFLWLIFKNSLTIFQKYVLIFLNIVRFRLFFMCDTLLTGVLDSLFFF